MSRTELTLSLLGVPRGSASGVDLSPGATVLCAYLALAPVGGRPRAIAASELFADCTESSARRRLSTALWRLRSELRDLTGMDAVTTADSRTLGFADALEVSTDADRFERLVSPVLSRPPADMTDDDASVLDEAVRLHTGRLLETYDDEWLMARRYRIENEYVAALDYLLQHAGARGDLAAVDEWGEAVLAIEPLREDLHRHLMTAYGAMGRMDLVEREFERCRRLLLAELGADPLPETIALYSRLTRGAGPLSPSVAALEAELEGARREIRRLGEMVDRALEHLRRLP
ncbi:UNVERIFIED_CONTAM: bacterial transcriptional activator domain-containing protein [Microbacterium sp. SLM126]